MYVCPEDKSVEGLPNDFFRPVDRSWSRDTAVACFCCCDGADPAATELMLRAASRPPSRCRRVPPRGAAGSTSTRRQLEEGRELRAPSAPSQYQLRRSIISSVAAAEAGDGSVLRP